MYQVVLFASAATQNADINYKLSLLDDISSLKYNEESMDLILKSSESEEGRTISCHSVVVAGNSELITLMHGQATKERTEEDKKEPIELTIDVPYKLLKLFIRFSYDGASVLHKYLEKKGPVLPKFYSPDYVTELFGDGAIILALGRYLMSPGMTNIVGEHILNKAPTLVNSGGCLAAWKWLENMVPRDLEKLIGYRLADTIAATNENGVGLLSSLTIRQLRSLLHCSINNREFKKGQFVKIRSSSINSSNYFLRNEVGVIENITGKTLQVKFVTKLIELQSEDLVVVTIY